MNSTKRTVWLLMVIGSALWAQPAKKLDSLLQVARTAGADSTRVWALMNAGKLYLGRQTDSALLYLRPALELSEKNGFEQGVVRCNINLAVGLYDLGRYDEAISRCTKVLPLCRKLGMGKEEVAANNLIANVWNSRGNGWLAIDFYERALAAMKTAQVPPHFPVVVRNNIGMLYNQMRLYEKGKTYSEESFEMAKAQGDDGTCGTAAQNIGNALLGLNRNEEAYGWFEQAVSYAHKTDYPTLLASCLSVLAHEDMKKNRLAQCEARYREGLTAAVGAGDPHGQMLNLHGLSLLFFEKKQFDTSERYARQALAWSDTLASDDYKDYILLTLSDLSLVKGRLTDWDTYRQQYQEIRDTLASSALVHAVEELEIKYETERKEQTISQLEQEKELQSLRLQRQQVLTYGAGGLALLLLSGGLLAWRFQKNRETLALQQLHIQEQTIRQLRQEQQIATANAVLRGQEEERGRLARDLHDGLGGMLSGIKQSLFAMKGNQVLSENSAFALNRVLGDLDHSINELRHIARNMMPEALVRFGLQDALHDYCEHLRQAAGLQVHFQAFGLGERLPQETEVVLFRIAQELLNNTVKHAHASEAIVQLIRDGGRISLTVEDNGQGFDPAQLERVQGVGWMNIRSRVSLLGGTLNIQSEPGRGTSVNVEIEKL